MSISDQQLIAGYLESGSQNDLDELVARHIGTVRNLAYRLVQCESTADDITQEVFLKAIRSLPTFQGDAQFSTWLYRITVNTATSHLRKNSARHELTDVELGMLGTSAASPEQQSIHAELANATDHALARLPTKLRTAIVLTAIEQLSVKEAAEIEGCTTATMTWRIHQARKKLKQLLHRQLSP